ncbi:MAG: hypothetical protein AB1452_01405 [Pseudomonadota bacterium]
MLLALALPVAAQDGESRTLDLGDGERIAYTLRRHPADAHVARPEKALAPGSALDTAKLVNLHLSTGDIEEAALLSNAPRRRFEVLRDYRQSIGEEEFKRVFAQYFTPENRLLAEIAIGRHRLLIWELKSSREQLAGQYFVEVEGRYLLDDVPSEARTRLRRVLEAYRAGRILR